MEIKTIVYKHACSVCYSSCDFIKNAFVLQLIFVYVVCGVMKMKISVIGFVKSGNLIPWWFWNNRITFCIPTLLSFEEKLQS